MINQLIALLKKPTIRQRGNKPFWDDLHISKGMPEAYLNPDCDAANRRHDIIDHSITERSSVDICGSSYTGSAETKCFVLQKRRGLSMNR